MGDDGRSTPLAAPRRRPPTAPPTTCRSVLAPRVAPTVTRLQSPDEHDEEDPPQLLKRTHSDPSLLCATEESRELCARWSFIRHQPEYRRLVWNIKVKQAFPERQDAKTPQTSDRVGQSVRGSTNKSRVQSCHSIGTDSDDTVVAKWAETSSRFKAPGAEADRNWKSRQGPLTGILRSSPSAANGCTESISRQVRFKDGPVSLPDGGKVSRHSSTDSLTSGGGKHPTGRRRQLGANVMMPQKTGVRQISIQMSDFYRPGCTKTMSVNYSSAILSQNSRILSEDLIRLSRRKVEARQAFVKRTERRLCNLRKNRELREQTKAERDRRKRMEEVDGDAVVESVYLRRPEQTLLVRPTAEMEELLTVSERKDFRTDRIKERTMLLPENYRTANYIKEYGEAQARTVGGVTYLRMASDNV